MSEFRKFQYSTGIGKPESTVWIRRGYVTAVAVWHFEVEGKLREKARLMQTDGKHYNVFATVDDVIKWLEAP